MTLEQRKADATFLKLDVKISWTLEGYICDRNRGPWHMLLGTHLKYFVLIETACWRRVCSPQTKTLKAGTCFQRRHGMHLILCGPWHQVSMLVKLSEYGPDRCQSKPSSELPCRYGDGCSDDQ